MLRSTSTTKRPSQTPSQSAPQRDRHLLPTVLNCFLRCTGFGTRPAPPIVSVGRELERYLNNVMGGDDGGRGSSSSSSGHLHLPSNTRKRRTVPPRLKLALVSACIAIVMLWWITPTPRNLYSPRAHARDTSEDPQARGILNTIVVPSYNEALNMEPL